jgi:hypothetical protein
VRHRTAARRSPSDDPHEVRRVRSSLPTRLRFQLRSINASLLQAGIKTPSPVRRRAELLSRWMCKQQPGVANRWAAKSCMKGHSVCREAELGSWVDRNAEPRHSRKCIYGPCEAQLGFTPGHVNQLLIGNWTGKPARAYSEAVCYLSRKTPDLGEGEGQLFSRWMCRRQPSGYPLGCTILPVFLTPVLLNRGPCV